MPLSSSGCASTLTRYAIDRPQGNFAENFALAYDNYAKAGIVLGAKNQGGNKSILENGIKSLSAYRKDGPKRLAAALAAYWMTVAITPDAPKHGGTVVKSVLNDASSFQGAFEAAIRASLNAYQKGPFYLRLITNVEGVVKQITWTVTEIMPPPSSSAQPFSEKLL